MSLWSLQLASIQPRNSVRPSEDEPSKVGLLTLQFGAARLTKGNEEKEIPKVMILQLRPLRATEKYWEAAFEVLDSECKKQLTEKAPPFSDAFELMKTVKGKGKGKKKKGDSEK